jgi:hypothetical protein
MDKLTTTIKRQWLREIVEGTKTVEYREIKPYWERRLRGVTTPFRLRLINGMSATAPEVTVEIERVVRNGRSGNFNLHIRRVIQVKNWDRRRGEPRQRARRPTPRCSGLRAARCCIASATISRAARGR